MKPVLLLDGPTEGIQPNIIKQIGNVIRIWCEQGDMAMVLVEQFFDFAYDLGDAFAVLKRGGVVLHARASALPREGLLAEIWIRAFNPSAPWFYSLSFDRQDGRGGSAPLRNPTKAVYQ